MNISRTGLLFQSDTQVHVGDSISGALNWPSETSDLGRMLLVVTGYVVWTCRSNVGVCVTSNRLLRVGEAPNRFLDHFDEVEANQEGVSESPTANPRVVLLQEEGGVAAAVSRILNDGG